MGRNPYINAPGYNIRAKLYAENVPNKDIISNSAKPIVFYAKEYIDRKKSDISIFEIANRDNRKIAIETWDLKESEVNIGDKVRFDGAIYSIINIVHRYNNTQREVNRRVDVKTFLEME